MKPRARLHCAALAHDDRRQDRHHRQHAGRERQAQAEQDEGRHDASSLPPFRIAAMPTVRTAVRAAAVRAGAGGAAAGAGWALPRHVAPCAGAAAVGRRGSLRGEHAGTRCAAARRACRQRRARQPPPSARTSCALRVLRRVAQALVGAALARRGQRERPVAPRPACGS